MTRFRRELSPDDAKIWRYVTRSVEPLKGMMARHPALDQAETDPPASSRVSPALRSQMPPRPSRIPIPPTPLTLGTTADIDRRTAQRLKRGDMAVDGRIDLHGLNLDQAHDALAVYIRSAYARGARCLVVVTGKGKGESIGKIRNETPHWLNQAPLRSLILAVASARPRDGGEGALYVLLKRKRG
ncbi:MAG: DNA mismatch repair protein MutS [Rhodospirillaceae bacterium]|nr:DNA mismatch repair protein MutS [Rhodospirillaceae bacterium]